MIVRLVFAKNHFCWATAAAGAADNDDIIRPYENVIPDEYNRLFNSQFYDTLINFHRTENDVVRDSPRLLGYNSCVTLPEYQSSTDHLAVREILWHEADTIYIYLQKVRNYIGSVYSSL